MRACREKKLKLARRKQEATCIVLIDTMNDFCGHHSNVGDCFFFGAFFLWLEVKKTWLVRRRGGRGYSRLYCDFCLLVLLFLSGGSSGVWNYFYLGVVG